MFLEVRNFEQVKCERARCHGGKTNCFSFTCLDFAPNALPQPLQNLTVTLEIDSLTTSYEFLVDNALDVGKNDQRGLDIATNLTSFFSPAMNLATYTATTAA
jgi:hypothetical protein